MKNNNKYPGMLLIAIVIVTLFTASCSNADARRERYNKETTEGFAEEVVNHSPRFIMINDTLASFSKRKSVIFSLNKVNRRFYIVK